MSWSWTLYRYLARAILWPASRVVYAGFLLLAFSIDIVDLLQPHRRPARAARRWSSAWRFCNCRIWARRCCPSPSCWVACSPLCGCRAARNWWRSAPPAFRPGISCCRRWRWRLLLGVADGDGVHTALRRRMFAEFAGAGSALHQGRSLAAFESRATGCGCARATTSSNR